MIMEILLSQRKDFDSRAEVGELEQRGVVEGKVLSVCLLTGRIQALAWPVDVETSIFHFAKVTGRRDHWTEYWYLEMVT